MAKGVKPAPLREIDIDDDVLSCLNQLVAAAISGTRSAEPVAAFLMAWHDSERHGGFDFSELPRMQPAARQAAVKLFGWLSENPVTPADLGLDIIFQAIGTRWAY